MSSYAESDGPPRGRGTLRPYGVVLALLFLLPIGCGGPQQAVCGMGGTTRLPGVGARLAFACQLDSRGLYSSQAIFVASPGGGPAVRATHGLAQDADPAWSPATGEIAFSSTRDGHLNVYAVRRDGADVLGVERGPEIIAGRVACLEGRPNPCQAVSQPDPALGGNHTGIGFCTSSP